MLEFFSGIYLGSCVELAVKKQLLTCLSDISFTQYKSITDVQYKSVTEYNCSRLCSSCKPYLHA